jgi:serine/threonine protein phosphatase PrpC
MKTFHSSLQGQRKYQEDRYGIITNDLITTVVVSDGMGGHPNGDKAAEAVISSIAKSESSTNVQEALAALTDALWFADKKCRHQRDYRGATATAIRILEKFIVYVHAGDTRFYTKAYKATELKRITEDHGHGSRLYNGIGFLQTIDKGTIHRQGIEALILTTDGIHDTLSEADMYALIQSALEADSNPAALLVQEAIASDSQDNCTAVVLVLGD